jgi:hypothetical protein
MSAAAELVNRLLDTVEAAEFERPDQVFADVGFAVFALAISKLASSEREATLLAIENGALRQAVAQFPDAASPLPKVTNGNGKALQ